jgi:cytidylate kinase
LKLLKKNIIIAIDGYSSCGKSTLAKALARTFQLKYIDSGAMYRAVTLYFLQNRIPIPLVSQINNTRYDYTHAIRDIKLDLQYNLYTGAITVRMNGKDVSVRIRSPEVSKQVSHVSAIRAVREKLVALQREEGRQGGIVMDGRDIGTTVFPQADMKIFMTAHAEIRAKRRYDELMSRGIKTTYQEVLKNINERDYEDSHRQVSPLQCAPDALVLDNTFLSEEEQFHFVINAMKEKELIVN